MRNINKLSPKAYLFLSVFSSLVAMIIYRGTIFRCLFMGTYNESKATLWLIWAACLVITYIITRKRRRNYLSLFTNTVLPFGIYTIITYDDIHFAVACAIMFSVLILCGLFLFGMIWVTDFPDTLNKIKNIIVHCLCGTKSIVAVCLSVLILYVSGLYAFESPSIIPAVKPVATIEEDKAEVLEKNLPIITKIEESIWKTLTLDERLDVMQVLANVEKSHLGISHEINVRADSLGLGTYGTYDHTKHEVTINTQVLMDDDSTDAVDTLCHEVRHAYQHDSAEAFLSLDKEYQNLEIFDGMRSFYENFEDYKNASYDGYDDYKNQTVEVDSRRYSIARSSFYFRTVENYLDKAA